MKETQKITIATWIDGAYKDDFFDKKDVFVIEKTNNSSNSSRAN
jgi:hypothetical protein